MCRPSVDEILAFCREDPVERVYLEDAARRALGMFVGVRTGARLTALCHVSANLVPSGEGCGALASVAATSGARMVIGEEGAVSDLWEAARTVLPAPREDRPGQPVYVLVDAQPAGETGLRGATHDDLDVLVPACARAHEEEVGTDSLARDAEGFLARTRAQIDEGRSWIWRQGNTILFKAEASAWTPSAVQLQQVWVDPEARREGYGQRGMRDLCARLLAKVPCVCLFVRANNVAAIRLYDRIGMQRALSYRTLIL
jgi:uncharacterized protein